MKTKDSYLELLFENRNKAYGAYELRINYERRLMKSFGMALLIAAMFFLVPYILTLILTHPEKIKDITKVAVIDMTKPFVIIPDKPEVVTSSSPHTNAETTVRVVRNNVVTEAKKTETKPADNATAGTTATNTNTDAKPHDTGEANGGQKEIVVPPVPVVMNAAAVDIAPSFPGGEKAMMKFLQNNIRYSALARENGISGKVFVAFIVNEKGEVIDVQIARSLEQTLDAEVVRVVNKMPLWSPGIFHGQAVSTTFMLPVNFALK